MRKIVLRLSLSTFAVVLAALTLLMTSTQTVVKADNNHAEQIVFSGTGTFGASSTIPGGSSEKSVGEFRFGQLAK